MRILVYLRSSSRLWRAEPSTLESLRRSFPDQEFSFPGSDGAFEGALPEAEVVLSWLVSNLLPRATSVKWVQLPSAGVPEEILQAARAHPHPPLLTTSSGTAAPGIAEQVVGYILAFNRRLPDAWRFQAARTWGQKTLWKIDDGFPECEQQSALIVGFGGIGRETAWRLAALGMRVLAVRRGGGASVTLQHPAGRREIPVFEIGELPELLPEADWLILAAPRTPETLGLIGASELDRLKPGAGLINVSRGELVDEKALVEALKSQRLRWAALDVFHEEPLPSDHPLWSLPNAILTPHVGGTSRRFVPRLLDLFGENLRRYLAGEPLKNLVNLDRGY